MKYCIQCGRVLLDIHREPNIIRIVRALPQETRKKTRAHNIMIWLPVSQLLLQEGQRADVSSEPAPKSTRWTLEHGFIVAYLFQGEILCYLVKQHGNRLDIPRPPRPPC